MKNSITKIILVLFWIITTIGCVTPWECYGDISWQCYSGIDLIVHWYQLNFVIGINLFILAILITSNLFLMKSNMSKRIKLDIVVVLDIGLLLMLLLQNRIIIENGGVLIIYVLFISIWLTIRDYYYTFSKILIIALPAVDVMMLIYYLTQIRFKEISEIHISGGTELKIGIVISLAGALILFVVQLFHLYLDFRDANIAPK
jgi:hypothetical protein